MARAKKVLALCASLVAAVLVGEAVARLCSGPPEYFVAHPFDPDLGFTEIPSRSNWMCDTQGKYPWVLNSTGFRGPELPVPGMLPADAGSRILFVGDSFLLGWEVREEALMPGSTQRGLASRGIAAQCFNVSCSGYGTGQELLLFRKHGEQVRPDFVVLCLYTGNDIVDNSIDLVGLTTVSIGAWERPYFVPGADGELVQTHLHPLSAWLRRHSRAFTLLDHRVYQWLYRDQGQYIRRKEGHPVNQDERLRQGLIPWADLELFLEPEPGGDWDRAWQTTEALLRTFDREVRALGARLLVVVIPHTMQVQSHAIFRQVDAAALDAGQASMLETLDWNLPERKLDAFFRAAGIEHICLLEHLRADLRTSGRPGYLHNFHLNSHGNELAGGLVAQELAALLGGGASIAEEDGHEGMPVDVLAMRWSAGGAIRFTEPLDDLLGFGWKGWSCDWFGAGPSWAMEREGWLVLPREQGRFVVEGLLPAQADFPVRLTASAWGRPVGATPLLRSPGSFELHIDLEAVPPGSAWVPVLIGASRTFPVPWGNPVGMLMTGIRSAGG